MKTKLLIVLLVFCSTFPLYTIAGKVPAQYPTAVTADYVIGCMAANGQTPEMLRKCACSIDFIASEIPIEEYEYIETLLRLRQMPGVGRNAVYKTSNWSEKTVARLREVQAESTLRCF
ncbi:MAG: hypothetical protein GY703_22040 [Gammaproteobacteria bacterium]|nr:hypothetical protein [Gammaproteobacteria bacterium]